VVKSVYDGSFSPCLRSTPYETVRIRASKTPWSAVSAAPLNSRTRNLRTFHLRGAAARGWRRVTAWTHESPAGTYHPAGAGAPPDARTPITRGFRATAPAAPGARRHLLRANGLQDGEVIHGCENVQLPSYVSTTSASRGFRVRPLSHTDFSGIRAGERVDTDRYDKTDRGFRLWKAPRKASRSGNRDRPGPAGAHRVLHHGRCITWRHARLTRGG